ncbi:MAG: CotH kinase family protein [Christensenellaceae bacterium]|nr:CotH kinase family protein [Christensenellaceae bacterium]
MRRVLLILLPVLMCPLFALAEDFYVMPAEEPGPLIATGQPIGAVSVWHNRSEGYLFLPAGFDADHLRVSMPEDTTVEIDGTALRDGDVTALFQPGQTVTVTAPAGSYPLTVLQSENIPALFLATASGKSDYIHDSKANREPGALLMVAADGQAVYSGGLEQLRIRGNTTAHYEKKPYQFKLENKTALVGHDKARSWALLANYIDHSLLRNSLALNLSEAAGLPSVPECASADVYLNNVYMGSYLLCETVSVGKGRVDIADLEEATEDVNDLSLKNFPIVSGADWRMIVRMWFSAGRWSPAAGYWQGVKIPNDPEDITGGYLLEIGIERDWDEKVSRFVTDSGWPLVIREPEYASVAQMNYIRGVFQRLDNAIGDPEHGWEALQEIVDVDSFVRKYVLEELLMNYDGGTGSQYFYKDADSRDPLIYCGPPWDYDNTLGINVTVSDPERFYVQVRETAPSAIFPRLWAIPEFREAAMAVYREDFRPLMNELLGGAQPKSLTSIAESASVISASAAMNFIRWPIDYSFHPRVRDTGGTWEKNVDDLISFLEQRVMFLDEAWQEQ